MTDTVLKTKASDERSTPQRLFDELDAVFRFDWDVAARRENCKVWRADGIVVAGPDGVHGLNPCYFGPDHHSESCRDALTVSWSTVFASLGIRRPTVWANPPYGKVGPFESGVPLWCLKAIEEARQGVTTVMLLAADTSTEYFHDLVKPYEHWFQRGRNKFGGAPTTREGKLAPAKFGSVLVIYRPPLPARWTRG